MHLSRRRFLATSGATAALAHPLAASAAQAAGVSGAADREPLRQLPYADVQLTGGPFAEQYNALHAHYRSLSNDSLLKVYRANAGMSAPGSDMGGWYDFDGFVPGHGLGQYISALARWSASTGDHDTGAKATALLDGFAATLGSRNQSILRPATNLWVCYTLDKHFAGLIDAATLLNYKPAPELLNRVLAGAQDLLPAKGRDRIGKKDPPYDETFVMPENLLLAAEITGNPQFRSLAERYLLNRELFDPLARGEDPFPGQHAYSHAIALSSAGRAFLSLGDSRHRDAMRGAFRLLTETQQFASGGWGPNETFVTPHRGELYASLATTVDHFETPCGAYAATKLARYLLRTDTPQTTAYADNLERVLFNTILAVKPPDSEGDYPYYSTYSPHAQKVYYPRKWPCCSGTLAQTVSDYPLNVYLKSADGVYVNLYTPSQASISHGGTVVRLQQATEYPAGNTVTLHVAPARPVAMTLFLRIPAWAARGTAVTVNGKPVSARVEPGRYTAVSRTWKAGDLVELSIAQDWRTEPIDDMHPGIVALMRGPVQYVALAPAPGSGPREPRLPASLKQLAPQLYAEPTTAVQPMVVAPLYTVQNQTYTTYFSRA